MLRSALIAALMGCLLASTPARAQEVQRFDDEKAKEVAKTLVAASDKLKLPVKVSVDGKSGTGLHAGKIGVFIVPDAKLTADALKKHEKGVLPLGLLYITN